MSQAEQEYSELVGESGHAKAKRACEILTNYSNNEEVTRLFYLALLNAYWRGVNRGVDDARDVINAKKAVTSDNKPTN